MKGEIHVYVNGMPSDGLVTFWEANEAVKMHRALVRTNQTHFINQKIMDMGYKIYVHKDGISTLIGRAEAKAIRKFVRGLQNDQ